MRTGLLALVALLGLAPAVAASRAVVDGAGRRVEVPARVERVFAAGGPASIILYTLAPERMLGWNRAPSAEEAAFLPERWVALPALGRLTGRGGTANVEGLLAARPDVIVDYGSLAGTYVSLADRIQTQTGVPYLLLDGRLDAAPAVYRMLGKLLDLRERAETLAREAARLLSDTDQRVATVPAGERPRVYYARGPKGLETGRAGSINVESLTRLGARNVAGEGLGGGHLAAVSFEQVLAWDPDVIVTVEPAAGVRDGRPGRSPVGPPPRRPRGADPRGPVAAVSVARLPALGQPAHRAALARPRALSRPLRRRPPRRGPGVLHDLLSPHAVRAAARRHAGRHGGWPALTTARRHGLPALAVGVGALIVLVGVALCVGRFPVTPEQLLTLLWSRITGTPSGLPPNVETVILGVRGPRVVAALAVGAVLAAAGAAYQGLFRNPLVSPDILGVSSGAALGAVLGIWLSLGVVAIQALAFTGGLLAVVVVYLIGSALRRHDPILVLVLAGVVIGTLLGSFVSLLKYLADPYNQLPAITFWLLGSLAAVTGGDVRAVLPAVVLGLVPLYLLRWRLNVMTLGDEEAQALGVDTRRVRLVVVAGATLMTAAVVSISGVVGWIGLLVPHIGRLVVGPDFGRLLPAAVLLGAGYLLGVDTLARTLARLEIPLGVLTALLGAPFFVWVLARARRGWT
jgi:iron complex transport system permease protein